MRSAKEEPDRLFPFVIRAEINWQGNQAALDRGGGKVENRRVGEVEGTRERKQQPHGEKFDTAVFWNSSRVYASVGRGGQETASEAPAHRRKMLQEINRAEIKVCVMDDYMITHL